VPTYPGKIFLAGISYEVDQVMANQPVEMRMDRHLLLVVDFFYEFHRNKRNRIQLPSRKDFRRPNSGIRTFSSQDL
jgi:hypothetical protein